MIKRLFIFIMLAMMAFMFFKLGASYQERDQLGKLGHYTQGAAGFQAGPPSCQGNRK